MSVLRILYVGALWQGSTASHRMVALQDLGHEVTGIDTTPPDRHMERRVLVRVLSCLRHPPDLAKANKQILENMMHNTFDVLWVDKGLTISPKTLRLVKERQPECRLVSYSPDDMLNPRNQSHRYRKCIPIYDLHVTTKSYNVTELKELGARDVLFIDNAYDPHTHRPIELSPEEQAKWGAEVGFIGAFENERFQMMLALAKAGIKVTIRGPGWFRYQNMHPNLIVKPGWVLGDDYTKAVCATKINLCFLRKVNRDLQTQRSVEIPACGGFMLAERTNEHLSLFEESKEAEFFSGEEELIAKVRYYLDHEDERQRIATAGRERCLRSGYSNHERLRGVLEYLYGTGQS